MRSHKRTRWVGLAALGLLVGTWVAGTARYGGPDEPAHVIRAAAVAQGDLLGDDAHDFAPGFRVVTVPAELATGDPICFRQDPSTPAGCSASRGVEGTVRAGTAAGIYPPTYYALVGLPVRALGAEESSDAYRIVAAVLTAGLLVLAATRARPLGRRALLIAAGIPPAAWFLFGVVNPNSIEIALALLAWVGIARIRPDAAVGDLMWVSVPIALAIATRPVGLLPAVAIAGTAMLLVDGWRRRAQLAAPLVAASVAIIAWNAWVGLEFTDPRTAEAASLPAALWRAVKGVPATLRESVGTLSWAELSAPWPAMVLWGVVAAALAVTVWRSGSRRERLALCLWLAVLVTGPVAFEVFAHDRVGFIWQGRYSISTLVGLGALAARQRADAPRALLAAAAVAEAAAFWSLLRRYTVGSGGSWWFAGERGWEPAVPPLVLLGVHVAVLGLVLGAICLGFRDGSHPELDLGRIAPRSPQPTK